VFNWISGWSIELVWAGSVEDDWWENWLPF
jgi:hypothetical protein